MPDVPAVRDIVAYIVCADAGLIADWCVQTLGFTERNRWPGDQGTVRNVELGVGEGEVWLDGPVPDCQTRLGLFWGPVSSSVTSTPCTERESRTSEPELNRRARR